MAISLTKAIAFRSFGALPLDTVLKGLIIGTSLMVGSWFAKRVVLHMHGAQFRIVLEAMMLVGPGPSCCGARSRPAYERPLAV